MKRGHNKRLDNAYHCKQCGYSWNANKGAPVICCKCNSPYWQYRITKDKPDNEYYTHFRRRLVERYGLRINKELYDKLNTRILENKEILLNPHYNGNLEVYKVIIDKTEVIIGFDRQFKNAVTALPYFYNYQLLRE